MIHQDISGPEGNCFAACLASILHLDMTELREFHERYVEACQRWQSMDPRHQKEFVDSYHRWPWWDVLEDELAPHNLMPALVPFSQDGPSPIGSSIVCGMSYRGTPHACVARNDSVIWDPDPSVDGTGLQGLAQVFFYVVLVPAVGP